ncbi:MAG: hypothetical protein WBO10_08310 [Pyrinomonadaceae bacterium]
MKTALRSRLITYKPKKKGPESTLSFFNEAITIMALPIRFEETASPLN